MTSRHLIHAANSIGSAATHHRLMSEKCSAMAALLRAIDSEPRAVLPVEELAKTLLPLDLCIVHKDVVARMLAFFGDTDEADRMSGEELRRLTDALQLSVGGRAQ